MRRLCLLIALCACTETTPGPLVLEVPEGNMAPPGYPPAMGTVALEDGGAKVLTTYDFSIGAFDASAFFLHMEEAPSFTLTAWPDADPDAKAGLLVLEARLPGKPAAGMQATTALVSRLVGDDRHGRRWTSEAGGSASLAIDSFTPETPGASSGYGHATGHFSARICSAWGDPVQFAPHPRCRDVSGHFETDVQFEP